MPISLDFFSGISWGNRLYFFDDLNVYIHVKSGFFDIISVPSGERTRIKIKYTDNFFGSIKHNKLFFTAPVMGESSHKKCYLHALDLSSNTYKRISLPVRFEFISMFLSEDESHITLIHDSGQIFRIECSNLDAEKIMNLDDFKLNGCYTWDDRFYLPAHWQQTCQDIFEYPITLEKDDAFSEEEKIDSFRIKVNIATKEAQCIPMYTPDDYKRFGGMQKWLYNKTYDIWSYCYICLKSQNPYNHPMLRYDFTESDKLLFNFEISPEDFPFCELKSVGDRYIAMYNDSCSYLYLVDLETWTVKYLEIKGKKIKDIFVNAKEGYIIPVFLLGGSKVSYFFDDFKPL
ncbi:MAG: hypothetical protein FWC75_04740 [Oscillospiraceae bacterium]|nr:hypothetical protein [Oscillospiraceae bacterium]